MSNEPKPIFLIIDGHALIYRAFHAFPPLLDQNGQVVGAMYGFLRILLSVLKQVQPTYWLVAFDHPAPTKRKLEYDFYKANRKEMPDELKAQIPLIEEAVSKLGIPEFKLAGIEADDLIGTISRIIDETKQADVRILTGDKDSFQLVNETIHVLVPNLGRKKDKNAEQMIEYNPAMVEQKMGVPPKEIIDLKALAGDHSDNIPGVPGIGDKTAVDLLQKFQSLEAIYQALDLETDKSKEIRAGVVNKLQNGRESAYISQKLATIDREVEVNFMMGNCKVNGYDKEEMANLLKKYGFASLLKLLPEDEFETGLQEALF